MTQEVNSGQQEQPQDQQHILDRITIYALPPDFVHTDIARHYGEGHYTNRLDAEVEDILRTCFPSQAEAAQGENTQPITVTNTDKLKTLDCIALLQGGLVLPLLDIKQMPIPLTTPQKLHLYHSAVRVLLDAVAAILEDRDERRSKQQDSKTREHGDDEQDGEQGETCHA